ncbi:nuclear transport factor 2 family protein [Sphingomonas sp.]|uniref:nuclear transport factor 2 family protein n=1 Tax=Sphingomonas sp. TaxID=28214 RepID=UPI0028AF1A93|nr:nuclear transport factor 2 family protein [Sphingomonas sp.]
MMTPEEIAKAFYGALAKRDWEALRALLHPDATWTLPGENAVSEMAVGAADVIDRVKLIISYGVSVKLENILLSRDNMALSLHNTAERDGIFLDEKLATVCHFEKGLIASIETFLSDVPGMNKFFV